MKLLNNHFFQNILVVIFSFIFGFGIFVVVTKLFTVSKMEIIGTNSLSGVASIQNKLIFFIDKKKVEKQLYDANPSLSSVSITKKYPDKIKINVTVSNPIAILMVADGYYYLASTGRIVLRSHLIYDQKPLITTQDKMNFALLAAGQIVDSKDVIYSLYFIEKMTDLGISIDSIDIVSRDVLVCKSGEITYLITTSKNKEIQFDELKTIVKEFRIEGKAYLSLDLRFDKPVVKFKTN